MALGHKVAGAQSNVGGRTAQDFVGFPERSFQGVECDGSNDQKAHGSLILQILSKYTAPHRHFTDPAFVNLPAPS
jgi:hypothetical protein